RIPLHYSDDADGSHRACTGSTLSRTRTPATPDCFTGRSHTDMEWDHDLKSGLLGGGAIRATGAIRRTTPSRGGARSRWRSGRRRARPAGRALPVAARCVAGHVSPVVFSQS
ncbi:hypothetical protein, partial [Streptomyces sp. NPDC056304]|uniref:hypothetical protein n=1 Tax=Streptomyces sp. NPDC056304 TaxID=3345778 RepID=UPI0035DD62E5